MATAESVRHGCALGWIQAPGNEQELGEFGGAQGRGSPVLSVPIRSSISRLVVFSVCGVLHVRNIELFLVIREQERNPALLGLIFVPLTSGRAKEGALDVIFPPSYFCKGENPHTPNTIYVNGFNFLI